MEKKKEPGKRKRIAYGPENNKLLLEIKKSIEQKIMYDKAKEVAFNRLYDEMNRYRSKNTELDKHLEPVVHNLVSLYDSMVRFKNLKLLEDKHSELIEEFDYLVDELLEIMYRVDMVPIEEDLNKEGSRRFNAQFQRAVKVNFTEREEDDYLIEAKRRKGFLWKGRVFRPEEVIIKRYRKMK